MLVSTRVFEPFDRLIVKIKLRHFAARTISILLLSLLLVLLVYQKYIAAIDRTLGRINYTPPQKIVRPRPTIHPTLAFACVGTPPVITAGIHAQVHHPNRSGGGDTTRALLFRGRLEKWDIDFLRPIHILPTTHTNTYIYIIYYIPYIQNAIIPGGILVYVFYNIIILVPS